MFCKSCGTRIDTKSSRCPHCGRSIDAMSGGTGFWDLVNRQDKVNTPTETPLPAAPQVPPKLNEPKPVEKNVEKTSGNIKMTQLLILILLLTVVGLQICLLLQIRSTSTEIDLLKQQIGINQSNLMQELSSNTSNSVDESNSNPVVEDEQVQPSPEQNEYPPVNTDIPNNTQTNTANENIMGSIKAKDLKGSVTFTDSETLCVEALLPEEIMDYCENDPTLIKWWVNEGNGEDEAWYWDNIPRTGVSQEYPVAYAEGNPEKYVYYTIEGASYCSEPIYLLSSIVTLYERNGIVIPSRLNEITAKLAPEENIDCYWEWCNTNIPAGTSTEWTRIDNDSLQSNYGLKLAEIDTDTYRFRFVIENDNRIRIAISELKE